MVKDKWIEIEREKPNVWYLQRGLTEMLISK